MGRRRGETVNRGAERGLTVVSEGMVVVHQHKEDVLTSKKMKY